MACDAADLGTGCVNVQMTVEAPDPAAAMVQALATLRAAIHAIGGTDSGWETTSAIVHMETRRTPRPPRRVRLTCGLGPRAR